MGVSLRVVVYIDLVRELLELVLAKWESLTEAQKMETAQYIIPEVKEGVLQTNAMSLDQCILRQWTISHRRIASMMDAVSVPFLCVPRWSGFGTSF